MTPQVGFSQREFGERWGLHPKTLGRWVRRGLIRPSVRIGKLVRYCDADLLRADVSRRAQEALARALKGAEQ